MASICPRPCCPRLASVKRAPPTSATHPTATDAKSSTRLRNVIWLGFILGTQEQLSSTGNSRNPVHIPGDWRWKAVPLLGYPCRPPDGRPDGPRAAVPCPSAQSRPLVCERLHTPAVSRFTAPDRPRRY